MKKLLIFLILILSSSIVSGTCSVTFDKDEYNPTETIEATMVCSGNIERSQAYTLTWANTTTTLQVNTGTTPSTKNIEFFQTYQIPTTLINDTITATLTGANLEGSDSATTTDTIGNALIIDDCKFSPEGKLGHVFAVDCEITDVNNKLIDNAHCSVYGTDITGAPLQECTTNRYSISYNGRFVCSDIADPKALQESTPYLAKVRCHCDSSENACFDEDGMALEKYKGSTSIPFEITPWLSSVNTVTDRNMYEARQVATICANITNSGLTRTPLLIYYQVRCGDENSDTDRTVIAANLDEQPDKRGISANTTQNQCWSLIIPEKRWMQGRTNKCYASTEVWVINQENKKIKGYFTTSPTFNITINDLGIMADWTITGENHNIITSIVNLSSDKYLDYNGVGIGNIDIRLDMNDAERTDPYIDSSTDGVVFFDNFLRIQDIYSVTTSYCNGTIISENGLEITNDGFIEVEIKNINVETSCIITEVEMNTYKNRFAKALEAFSNKLTQWLGWMINR